MGEGWGEGGGADLSGDVALPPSPGAPSARSTSPTRGEVGLNVHSLWAKKLQNRTMPVVTTCAGRYGAVSQRVKTCMKSPVSTKPTPATTAKRHPASACGRSLAYVRRRLRRYE